MSRSQKNKRRKVYRQMMATRMGFTRQTFEIDYFTSITIERGQQWIGVQWRTGMHTLQPVEQLREDLNPSTFRKMMSMATRDNATPEQSVVLATTREKWLKSQPGAVTRAQARLAPASTSTLPPITDNDCKDVEPPLLQRCTRCARVSPGEHVSPFVCWHCSDANAAPVDLVQRHGTPRPHDVVVWCGAGEPEFIDLVRVTVDSTGQCAPLVTSAGHDKKVDIVIVSYHEDNKTLSEHIALVNAAIASRSPSIVLVLSCWRSPAVQTEALQRLAVQHPATTFVTFRVPNVSPPDCLNASLGFLISTIVFPKAQHFIFLSQLCASRGDCALFASCGPPVAHLCGPLVPVLHTVAQTFKCVGCTKRFAGRSRAWRRDLPDLLRYGCQSTMRLAECISLVVLLDTGV